MLPAIAVLTGVVTGTFSESHFRFALPVLPLLWMAAIVCWRTRASSTSLACLVAAFWVAGTVLAADARDEALHPSLRTVLDGIAGGFSIESLGPENEHEPFPIRAELLEDAAIRDDYVSLRTRVTAVRVGGRWLNADGGVAITVSGETGPGHADAWRAGRTIEAPLTFRRPARYLNDGVADFERQLALDGTTLFGSIKSVLLIGVTSGSRFEEWAGRVRARVRAAVGRWVAAHDAISGAIVVAVLIGDRSGLPAKVNERLQRAGTYHVIAISGGNIAVLAGVVLGLLALAGIHGQARAVAAIAVLILYAHIASAGPSVWRATLMAVAYLTARLLDHRTPPWQATAVAAGLMAIATPLDVQSAGFILTFGAVGALVEGGRRMRPLLLRVGAESTVRRRLVTWLFVSLAASIAVELVLAPVSAQSFSRVTLAGPLLNLVAVPLMAVAQIAGLVVVACDACPPVARPAGWLASTAASGIVESARFVDMVPALSWRVPPPGIPLLTAYYGLLLVLLCGRRAVSTKAAKGRVRGHGRDERWVSRLQIVAIPSVVVAFVCIIGAGPRREPPGIPGIRLTVFDVGQGDAMLLESGRSRLLIDAGGAPFGSSSFDIGARVVAPALWARRIAALDAVLATHGDPDHIGGAPVLLEAFRPGELWEGVVVPRHEPSGDLRNRATAGGMGVRGLRAGESFQWGRTRIRVLHPPEPDWERPRVRNDDSVVLEATCGDVTLLLTGDISGEVEREIAPQLTPARVRILKVGHHGSRTSSSPALLESWRPQIALISAGRGNTFGHPTPEVIARLESIGARIYRTDRDGQVTVETDCRHALVRTFTGLNHEEREEGVTDYDKPAKTKDLSFISRGHEDREEHEDREGHEGKWRPKVAERTEE